MDSAPAEPVPVPDPKPPVGRPIAVVDRLAWGFLAVASVGLFAGLAQYWQANPGHVDRLLVLVGAGWAAWKLLPFVRSAPVRPRPVVGLVLVALGSAALPAALYLEARVGGRTLLLWWQAAALLFAAAGLILTRHGWPHLRRLAFPLIFPLFALPLPTAVESPLQQNLKETTTRLAVVGLRGVGIPVERSGVVLHIPSGDLGMADACSGIRSLPALTALSAFVAFLWGFGPVRGVTLVALAVPVAIGVNVLRVVLTGLIHMHCGKEYIEGNWHEALGTAMVLVGLGAILGLARLLELGRTVAVTPEPTTGVEPPTGTAAGWAAAGVLGAAAVGGLAAAYSGWTATATAVASAPLAELPLELPGWHGRDLPIPDTVREMLVYDSALSRVYTDNLGQEAHVWVVFWTAASAQRGNHTPDICMPSRGFTASMRAEQLLEVPGGTTIPVSRRKFSRGSEALHVVHWVQEGTEFVSDGGGLPASSLGWVRDLLLRPDEAPAPRLMVLVFVPAGTAVAEDDAGKLAGQLAAELYRLCPWANPQPARSDNDSLPESLIQVP